MRRLQAPSEIGHLAAPLARGIDAVWQRMHWWIGAMVVLYAISGTTIVKADEVAVVLRWGRLVGETAALQEHGAGLLFAFPKPIDEVVRIPVKHVYEVTLTTLASDGSEQDESGAFTPLNPVWQGYAVTGDQNIVQTNVVARYRIRDAAEWAFYGPRADDVLRVEVTAAMIRAIGEMGVDKVLAEGRKDLLASAAARAQEGLDVCHSGLELTSLELASLAPPRAVAEDFNAVQSAFIGAETKRKEAKAYAESAIPEAQAKVDTTIQAARGDAQAMIAKAHGEAAAFLLLDREYRANPDVVRERLYRDSIETAIGAAGNVRWVPPPVGGVYNGLRITVPSNGGAPPPPAPAGTAPSNSSPPPPVAPIGDDDDR